VDEFLRATVQPYVTKIEQDSAPTRAATRLWDDFTNDPNGTFLGIAEEIYGADEAAKIRAALAAEEAEVAADPTEVDPYAVTVDELPPEVREVVEWAQDQKRSSAWDEGMAKVRADHPDLTIKDELFAPFVTVADGDLTLAAEAYREHINALRAEAGAPALDPNVPTPADIPDAPVTIGRAQASGTTPPVEEVFETTDDALDSLISDMRHAAKAPTTL
jgi:hypothetical protein